MGGPSADTQRRKARNRYAAAALRLQQAMADVGEPLPPLDPAPVHLHPRDRWTPAQREAMKRAADAWAAVIERRAAYELAGGADVRDWR